MSLKKPDTSKPGFGMIPGVKDLVDQGTCPGCVQPIREEDFKDQVSKDEYSISGLCQKCQDGTLKRIHIQGDVPHYCDGCGKQIVSTVCQYGTKEYCVSCSNAIAKNEKMKRGGCDTCGTPKDPKTCHHRYEDCYDFGMWTPKPLTCPLCNGVIETKDLTIVDALKKITYHKVCFYTQHKPSCNRCKAVIDGTIVEHENEKYCIDCYIYLFKSSPAKPNQECKVCQKKIVHPDRKYKICLDCFIEYVMKEIHGGPYIQEDYPLLLSEKWK